MVARVGLEPTQSGSEPLMLPLHHLAVNWLTEQGSNLHQPDSKSGDLPISLSVNGLVTPAGIEPALFG